MSHEQVLKAKEAQTPYPHSEVGGEEVGRGGQGDGVSSSGVAGFVGGRSFAESDGERVGTHSVGATGPRVREKEANRYENSDVLWMLQQVVDILCDAAHGRGAEERLRA